MADITWRDFGTVISLILTCILVGEKLLAMYRAYRSPHENLRNRVQVLEENRVKDRSELDKQKEKLDKLASDLHNTTHDLHRLTQDYEFDHRRMDKLESGQTAILYGIDALLDNAINGDNMEGLNNAKKHITKHMIEG